MKHQIIKIYRKNTIFGKDWNRVLDEKKLAKKGYYPISEEDITKYSGGKGLLLGLIFLPLALMGNVKKVRVVYEKNTD